MEMEWIDGPPPLSLPFSMKVFPSEILSRLSKQPIFARFMRCPPLSRSLASFLPSSFAETKFRDSDERKEGGLSCGRTQQRKICPREVASGLLSFTQPPDAKHALDSRRANTTEGQTKLTECVRLQTSRLEPERGWIAGC